MLNQIPNILTFSRIVIIPLIIYLYFQELFLLLFIAVILGTLSDYYDGIIARKFNFVSTLGSISDPIADKFFILTLVGFFTYLGHLPLWYCLLVFIRNVSQLFAVPLLGWVLKIPFKVKPKKFAKWGTILSMLVIIVTCFLILIEMLPEFLNFSYINNLNKEWLFFTNNWVLVTISGYFEVIIFITYIIRLSQIIRRTHDTFE